MIQKYIRKLVSYGVKTGLVPREDIIFTTNKLLELFKLDELTEEAENMSEEELEISEEDIKSGKALGELLGKMLDYACENGLIEDNTTTYRDLFDTKILIAKYLTGEIGGYVPSHPIAKIYVYNDKYKNDTLTFTNIVDKNNRLSAYIAKSHNINVSRHFDFHD